MVFITNHPDWSAGSVCDLYKACWEIEVFLKQVKQTLRLSRFFGLPSQCHPQNAKTAKLLEQVPEAFESILRSERLSQWVTVVHGPFGYCTWDVMPSQGKMPRNFLWIQTEVTSGSFLTYPINPADEGRTPNALSVVHLRHLSFAMLDRISGTS